MHQHVAAQQPAACVVADALEDLPARVAADALDELGIEGRELGLQPDWPRPRRNSARAARRVTMSRRRREPVGAGSGARTLTPLRLPLVGVHLQLPAAARAAPVRGTTQTLPCRLSSAPVRTRQTLDTGRQQLDGTL